ncbi:MAG TPA: NUDIX hydrolase [Thermoanaerobaculia bacterium]|jgi:ADP-ribose pyrophosphatase|nr:NUDIX hydrolase [Thermoanaerobaculia bacterium]
MADDVEVLGEGRHLRLLRRRGWEFVTRRGVRDIVVLIAVTPGGELLLVEQHREAVGAAVIELPAGLAGDEPGAAGEGLEDAAQRELREETGWEATTWERLASGPPSAGASSEVVTLLRGRGLVRRGPGGGAGDERIRVHTVPLAAAAGWLGAQQAAGRLVDPKVWAGLWFAGAPPGQ